FFIKQGAQTNGVLNFFIRSTAGNHWPHLRILTDDEVNNHGAVINFAGTLDSGDDFFLSGHADGFTTHRFTQLDEVWNVSFLLAQLRVRVIALVEQGLPLTNHAEVTVINNRNLDGETFDCRGGQLLVGHLEATITIDCPDFLVWQACLCAERCGYRVAHGASTT